MEISLYKTSCLCPHPPPPPSNDQLNKKLTQISNKRPPVREILALSVQ